VMAVEVSWLPAAREDLLEIYLTIGLGNSNAAERFFAAIEAKADGLRQHPRLGPRRRDIRLGMRMLVEGPYLILYQIHPDTEDGPVDAVQIVRVVDGRRDLATLF
jgi:toxin ParE1/3/4